MRLFSLSTLAVISHIQKKPLHRVALVFRIYDYLSICRIKITNAKVRVAALLKWKFCR
jgi:hypothetical protein